VIRTWSARGSEQLRIEGPQGAAMAFTADGRRLALLGERGEELDARSGRVLRRYPGTVRGAGDAVATAGLHWVTYLDPRAAGLRIDELEGQTGRRVASVGVPRLDAQGVAPDGRIAAAYVDGDRLYGRIIDPRTGSSRLLQPGHSSDGCAAATPSFTPSSRLMAVVDECLNVAVWDLRTGRLVRNIVLPDRSSGSPALLTPDGRYVLVTVIGGAFARVDLRSGEAVVRPGAETEGNTLAIAPDGRYYAIGRQDGTVDVYDARSLRLIRHHVLFNPVQSLVFSPDGARLAIQDTLGVIQVWDSCDVCQNAGRLGALAAAQSVRELTPGERATFGVG
jgi:hypothetical protein